MTALHRIIAYGVPAAFLLVALAAAVGLIRNKAPGGWFWTLVGIVQVVLGIQVIVGGVLFVVGNRPVTSGPEWLHYVYGGLFPAALLLLAHRLGKRFEEIPWVVFGIISFVCFGLTFRALQTGLGWFE
ncbi:MAG: hypothetical protein M3198_18080 [Actinomycetota bacterium]|nr:hypothetical protein [Actinomycetota bacterium]